LALLTLAVGATTVGMGLAANAGSSLAARFGTATRLISLDGSNPNLGADIATARRVFGRIEVIQHRKVAVPGSVTPIDLRAESPNGAYGRSTLRLDEGRYPLRPREVAVTDAVASIFKLHLGGTWSQGGADWRVVGLVENPLNLLDEFALVAPGQANPPDTVTILIRATEQQIAAAPPIDGADVEVRPPDEQVSATLQVLVLATIGLLFIGLVAVAGFTVMAGRRVRALGMLGAIGAADKHVRLVLLGNGAVVGAVAAVTGTAVGLAGWFASAPRVEAIVEHRINRFDLPWWAIGLAMLLAIVTAVAAAWWPSRSAARIPIVAALSARPAPPRPAHRFAAVGAVFLLVGIALLALSHRARPLLIVGGIVATTLGMLFLAPVGIAGLAAVSRRGPIAIRLALRDLGRYQARSGAALAAVSLAVAIAVTIVISAAASQAAAAVPGGSNLPPNQLIVWLSPYGGPGPVRHVTPAEMQSLRTRVHAIVSALGAHDSLALQAAIDPTVPEVGVAGTGARGTPVVGLGKPIHIMADGKSSTEFRGEDSVQVYVATPSVLEYYGIDPSAVNPGTDILTSRSDVAGLELIPGRHSDWHPKIQRVALPTYTSDPTTLITAHALRTLGFSSVSVGWLIESPVPLTGARIDGARRLGSAAGLSIETRPTKANLSQLRTGATAAGVLLALCVLAMTVGLIRSETARDLRTLTAAGASSGIRRTLTGATSGSLALVGALLGTIGAYVALIAWYRGQLQLLEHVPFADLAIVVVGLPLAATLGGWLMAGREPPAISRQPLE